MRRTVVMSVLCGIAIAAAWHYGLTLAMVLMYRDWLMGGALLCGCVIASMWLCPRTVPSMDITWYLALFPGLGMFSAGIGSDCDDSSVVHGRRI